jgi:hypothetical protein
VGTGKTATSLLIALNSLSYLEGVEKIIVIAPSLSIYQNFLVDIRKLMDAGFRPTNISNRQKRIKIDS